MARSIRDSLSGFGSELLERIREDSNAWLDEVLSVKLKAPPSGILF